MNPPSHRTEIDLAVADGFLSATDAAQLAGAEGVQVEALRARLGDEVWATLTAQAAALRAISRGAEQVFVQAAPGRYRPHRDPARLQRRELGRGAQGAVEVVWDAQLERDVAMKVLRPGVSVARFVREARVLSQLDHPGLPTLYELGRTLDGQLYFTMRYVQGQPLATRAPGALGAALTAFMRACEVVAHAHSRGVVHRDLKPEHVLVGEHGAISVLDWGLARLKGVDDPVEGEAGQSLPPERGVTQLGTMLGTPGFRAPEQEHAADVGPAADIYALGRILETLLPWDAARPLQSIVQRATRERPEGRYPNAMALSADVGAWLEHRVVLAHRYSLADRGLRLSRRYARGLAVLALLGLGSTVVALVYLEREHNGRAPVYLEKALAALRENGDPAVAQVYAAAAMTIEETPEARGALIAAMSRWRPRLVAIHRRDTESGHCDAVAVHESGTWACALSKRDEVEVYRPDGTMERWPETLREPIRYMSWAQDGRSIATFGERSNGTQGPTPTTSIVGLGSISGRLYDTSGVVQPGAITWISPLHVAVAEQRSTGAWVLAVDVQDKHIVWEKQVSSEMILIGHVIYDDTGNAIVAGGSDGQVFVLSASDGELQHVFNGQGLGATILAASNGRIAAAGSQMLDHPDKVRLINTQAGELLGTEQRQEVFDVNTTGWPSLLFMPQGAELLIADLFEGRATSIDVTSRQTSFAMITPPVAPNTWSRRVCLQIMKGGHRLIVAGGSEPEILEFDLDRPMPPGVLRAFKGSATSIGVTTDGDGVWIGGPQGEFALWDMRTGKITSRHHLNVAGSVMRILPVEMGVLVAANSSGLWHLSHPDDAGQFLLPLSSVGSLSRSPSGRWYAIGVGGLAGDLIILDGRTLKVTSLTHLFSQSIYTAEWLDDHRIYTSSFTGETAVIEVDDAGLAVLNGQIKQRGFSGGAGTLSDTDHIVTFGHRDHFTLHQYSLKTDAWLSPLAGHTDWPIVVDQHDVPGHGVLLASASWDSTVRLWSRMRPIAKLQGHALAVWSTQFSPDGRWLASASADGTARIWRLFLDTDGDGTDDKDLLTITGEEALQDARDRFGLVLNGYEVAYAEDWSPPNNGHLASSRSTGP